LQTTPQGKATAQAQEGGAEGFSGDRDSGEHGARATAASAPLLVDVLPLLSL